MSQSLDNPNDKATVALNRFDVRLQHIIAANEGLSNIPSLETLPPSVAALLAHLVAQLDAANAKLNLINTVIVAQKIGVSPKEAENPYMLVQRLAQELSSAERSLSRRTDELQALRQECRI